MQATGVICRQVNDHFRESIEEEMNFSTIELQFYSNAGQSFFCTWRRVKQSSLFAANAIPPGVLYNNRSTTLVDESVSQWIKFPLSIRHSSRRIKPTATHHKASAIVEQQRGINYNTHTLPAVSHSKANHKQQRARETRHQVEITSATNNRQAVSQSFRGTWTLAVGRLLSVGSEFAQCHGVLLVRFQQPTVHIRAV